MNHLKLQVCKECKQQLERKETRDQDIANKLATYNAQIHVVSENVAENIQVFCVKVVSTFLHAGVPLNKLDIFTRQLLRRLDTTLQIGINMNDLIPFIHKQEFQMRRNFWQEYLRYL